MGVERKRDGQKAPEELAVEQTQGEPEDKAPAGAEQKPKRKAESKGRAKAENKGKAKAESKPKGKAERSKAPSRGAPARRRSPRRRDASTPEASPTRPEVRAQAKYVRSSARKARLVLEHIRGKSVEEARAVLRHTPRAVARDLERVLNSAVANAENNHELVGDDLLVKEAHADEGPTIKRFRPRALGRATRIRKRTSHLTVTLTTKEWD
jgi:ribosomal protein L22